uniref:Uncharacterized protein n=1 Tax=viral metagenome TaxID=1070528 RepID=A0A6C0CAI2_9ZZZZ
MSKQKKEDDKFFQLHPKSKSKKPEIDTNDVQNRPVVVCTPTITDRRTWYHEISYDECMEYLKYKTLPRNACSSKTCIVECMFLSENEIIDICRNNIM